MNNHFVAFLLFGGFECAALTVLNGKKTTDYSNAFQMKSRKLASASAKQHLH